MREASTLMNTVESNHPPAFLRKQEGGVINIMLTMSFLPQAGLNDHKLVQVRARSLSPAESRHGFTVITITDFSDTNSLSSSSLGPRFEAQGPLRTQRENKHGFTVITITDFSNTNSLSSSSLGPRFEAQGPLRTQRENRHGPVVLPLRGGGAVIMINAPKGQKQEH